MKDSNRKLATILATDCVDFSMHMEENEDKTLKNLNQCRKIIDTKIAEYGGRIFHTAGDSVIAEFNSPVQCVKASIEFQNEIYKRNKSPLTELQLQWRVGIHVDDIIVEGDNIMGSGVNIAARIESHCHNGQILVSKIVRDQVVKRVNFKIEADGTRDLKNISPEYEVFKVRSLLIQDDDLLNTETANKETQTVIEKSKKPKIAILTFENLSKDDDSEFLVEAVTGDLIIEFSRMKEFDVVSKKTCDDHDNSDEDSLAFAKKHRINFLVGGNIRSSGKRIRISVILTNADDGSIIWGDKYDRVLEDIFDIQDEIVQKISKELLGNIEISNLQNIKRKPTENLNSYEWLIKGRYHWFRGSIGKEHNLKAIEAFDNAIKLDEQNARAHALKACTIGGGLGKQYYENNDKMMKQLFYHVEKSLEFDENDYECQRISSAINLIQKNYTKSEEHGKYAYKLNPNDPRVLAVYGEILVRNNKHDEGLKYLHKALELDPVPAGQNNSDNRYGDLVLGYFCKKDFDNCIIHAEKIEKMQARPWLFLLYSLNQKHDDFEIKEHTHFKNNFENFNKLDWENTVSGFNIPDDKINENLIKFSYQIIN